MLRQRLAGACLGAAMMMSPTQAQVPVPSAGATAEARQQLPRTIESARQPAMKTLLQGLSSKQDDAAVLNAVRVAADLQAADAPAEAFFTHYTVPATAEIMRLPDVFPIDGRHAGTLSAIVARDEYEPASFVVYSFVDADRVELKVSELKSDDGRILPADRLDLKVVKVWYQNGNAWFSYFNDVGLTLVPELLLHDENLVRVDTEKQANYARVSDGGGRREVWISAPRKADVPFDHYTPGFADAPALQPVAFKAGHFKQFILTVHATKDTVPGTYRGSIEVLSAGRQSGRIPVAVRVLPFELPQPKANHDLERDYIVTLMGAWPRIGPDHPAFMPTLRNLRAHNILHLGPNVGPQTSEAVAQKSIRAMKDVGFSEHPIINGTMPFVGTHDGTPYTFDDLMVIRKSAAAWREFYLKHFGHTDAAISYGDEQTAPWVMKARPLWRILHEHGLKTNLAGHEHIFAKAGYTMDIHPTAGSPADDHKARKWRQVGSGHVAFYASQHNGSENPAFVRRQHGLLGYLSGFDMINNYEFAYGPWNDRAVELYKPMVLAYPTSDGLVDTLAWEGFREGVDDMRYATKLRQLSEDAIASKDLDRVYAGRQVKQWFALMDGQTVDLHAVRLEMIDKIERLMAMVD